MHRLIIILVAILFFISLHLFVSCTYNISMAHTQGSASDVIDDTQSPTNDLSPVLSW